MSKSLLSLLAAGFIVDQVTVGADRVVVPVSAPGASGELDDPTAAPESLMAIPAASAPVPVAVATVRLLPLDEAGIRRLAAHYGVKRADAFIDALKETGHLFLAVRSRDLEWLAEYWNREGLIRTRWNMLKLNVIAKVQEPNVVHSDWAELKPVIGEKTARPRQGAGTGPGTEDHVAVGPPFTP